MRLSKVTPQMLSRQPDQTANWLNRLSERVEEIGAENGKQSSNGGGDYRLPVASATTLGGIKVGDNLSITPSGVLSAATSGTSDYNSLTNQPQINQVTLRNNKELPDLGVNPLSNFDIDNLINNT